MAPSNAEPYSDKLWKKHNPIPRANSITLGIINPLAYALKIEQNIL